VLDHWLESEFQGGGSTAKVEKMDKIDERFRGQRSPST
jgi:ribose 5-phosphate isomerase RpiB